MLFLITNKSLNTLIKFLLVNCILICSTFHSYQAYSQPKIIITKFKCSKTKNVKFLYDKIRGCKDLECAYKNIEKYFINANGDNFQLKCVDSCNPPLVLEFPMKLQEIIETNDFNLNTTYKKPSVIFKISGIISEDSAVEIKGFFFNNLTSLNIINATLAFTNNQQKEMYFEKDSSEIPKFHYADYLVLIDVQKAKNDHDILSKSLFMGFNSSALEATVRVINPETREVVASHSLKTSERIKQPKGYSSGTNLDSSKAKEILNLISDNLVNDLPETRESFLDNVQFYTRQPYKIAFESSAMSQEDLKNSLITIQSVIGVHLIGNYQYAVYAACPLKSLKDFINESHIRKFYKIIKTPNRQLIGSRIKSR